MIEPNGVDLKIVDALELPAKLRNAYMPGDSMSELEGAPSLPRYFYEVPSWKASMEIQLAPNFGLWELIDVDFREAEPVRLYPRYIPCALAVMAGYLQRLRDEVGRVVRIAANGGYRSPSHQLSPRQTPHCWGTAVNVYRIGDDWMDSRDTIEKYRDVARRTLPAAWVRDYGEAPGGTFDHLHIDLGYFSLFPRLSGNGDGTQSTGEPEESQ